MDDVIAKIEERMGDTFKENEVVHTFGSTGTLSIHGLTVPHIEPSEIAEDRRIRVVLFKENLSTGWDCPRAETMMSFRRAEDATYIAQLLGRMVRTPLQSHILVDDSLNDVRLFLPYFNQDTVQKVIDKLQATEGGEIPTVVDGESLEDQTYDTWSVHSQRKKVQKQAVGQLSMFDYPNGFQAEPAVEPFTSADDMQNSGAVATDQGGATSIISTEGHQAISLETVSGNGVHAGQEAEGTSEGILNRYPSLSEREAHEILSMVSASAQCSGESAELVVTSPPSFALRAKPTKVTVRAMLMGARKSILITGYSLSDYFAELVDCVIQKSQEGVLVKFFVNDIESQKNFDRLCSYKGKFLRIYNYPKQEDKMSALHAKVISIDQTDTLITSANLSYHGQEGNIELGTQVHSKDLAKQVEDVFTRLVFSKVFEEVI